MASELAHQRAATAWCTEGTSHLEINPDLCEAFADIIDDIWSKKQEIQKSLFDMIGAVQMMSGSPDFGPDGFAHQGWLRIQPLLDKAMFNQIIQNENPNSYTSIDHNLRISP